MQTIKLRLDEDEADRLLAILREDREAVALRAAQEAMRLAQEATTLFTTRQAAQRLGCSEPTLREWRRAGKIDFVKVGKGFMFTQQAINDAVNRGTKHSRLHRFLR